MCTIKPIWCFQIKTVPYISKLLDYSDRLAKQIISQQLSLEQPLWKHLTGVLPRMHPSTGAERSGSDWAMWTVSTLPSVLPLKDTVETRTGFLLKNMLKTDNFFIICCQPIKSSLAFSLPFFFLKHLSLEYFSKNNDLPLWNIIISLSSLKKKLFIRNTVVDFTITYSIQHSFTYWNWFGFFFQGGKPSEQWLTYLGELIIY